MQITTYETAQAHLKRGRNKDYRPLPGRSTTLERRPDGGIAVRYHATDVVTFTPGRVRLDSGGWRTMTTKERMSTYSPVIVSQDHGLWYVAKPPCYWANRDEWLLFDDGITFTDEGELVGEARDGTELEAAKRKVDRMVAKYVKGYCAHLREVGHVEEPGPGDCWYCLMRTEEGKNLGDASGNVDHLLSHFDEGYHVPALLWWAIEERNYGGGVGFIVASTNIDLEQRQEGRYSLSHVKDSLRGYFRRRKLALAEELLRQEAI